jgi:hypothetical protein
MLFVLSLLGVSGVVVVVVVIASPPDKNATTRIIIDPSYSIVGGRTTLTRTIHWIGARLFDVAAPEAEVLVPFCNILLSRQTQTRPSVSTYQRHRKHGHVASNPHVGDGWCR